MNISTIGQPTTISFGYNNIIKTLYKKGKLPTVKYGFYGDKLTKKNVSLDHLIAHSKGGQTCTSNLVLASKHNNQLKGDKSVISFFNEYNVSRYLNQFIEVKINGFDGNKYILDILETLKEIFNSDYL